MFSDFDASFRPCLVDVDPFLVLVVCLGLSLSSSAAFSSFPVFILQWGNKRTAPPPSSPHLVPRRLR